MKKLLTVIAIFIIFDFNSYVKRKSLLKLTEEELEILSDKTNGRCGICGICGGVYNLEIHHLIYRSRGGNDSVCNLLLLCRNCHSIVHKEAKVSNKLIIDFVDDKSLCHLTKEQRKIKKQQRTSINKRLSEKRKREYKRAKEYKKKLKKE